MVITKREDVTKQGEFCKNTLKKTASSGGSYWRVLLEFLWEGVEWGGRLLTFSAFSMGAYSKWALIRGWAFIRISTVPDLSEVID